MANRFVESEQQQIFQERGLCFHMGGSDAHRAAEKNFRTLFEKARDVIFQDDVLPHVTLTGLNEAWREVVSTNDSLNKSDQRTHIRPQLPVNR